MNSRGCDFMTCDMRTLLFLLHAGVHPKVVSERLGHSSINLTMDTYSHVMKTLQADAIAGLDAMVPLRRSVAEKRSA